eukprot:5565152-Prymnesium_polylepis.1
MGKRRLKSVISSRFLASGRLKTSNASQVCSGRGASRDDGGRVLAPAHLDHLILSDAPGTSQDVPDVGFVLRCA